MTASFTATRTVQTTVPIIVTISAVIATIPLQPYHLGEARAFLTVDSTSRACAKGFFDELWVQGGYLWVVVKTMVPFFGVPIIVRHLIFRVPKKGP